MGRRRALIGIDLGSREAKAVEVIRGPRGDIRVTGFARMRVPPGEERRGALSELLRRGRFRARRAVVSVSGKNVFVRFIQMPRMSDEDLRSAVPYEADKYLPFESGKMVLDYQRLDDVGSDAMRVLLVAAPRGVIDEMVFLLEGASLVIDAVDVDAFAIGNAFVCAQEAGGEGLAEGARVGLVDVGASKSVINIVGGGLTEFTREVATAGDAFTAAIARRLGIPPEEAEELKRLPGERHEAMRDAVVRSLEELASEVHVSFDYYENQSDRKVEAVYLSGGSSQLDGMPEAFARALGRPVVPWDPTFAFPVAGGVDRAGYERAAPHLAVAVGLAARAMDVASA